MTDQSFFKKYQRQIRWIFNTRLGRWFFKINRDYSSVGDKKIIKVLPNAIQWLEGYRYDGENWRIVKTTEFRTNNRFAYRMNTLLKYLPFIYWTENWYPALQVGLTVTTVYPDADPESTSVDGIVEIFDGAGQDWADIQGAATGTNALPSATTISATIDADSITDKWDGIQRSAILFDTSAIGDTDTLDSAVLSVWPNSTLNDFTSNLDLVTSNPASNTDLVAADYDQFGTTLQATSIAISAITTGQYNDFTLNATGESNVDFTGVSKFGLRISQDTANTEPTWSANAKSQVIMQSAENSNGADNAPKLAVTHSEPITANDIYGSKVI